MIKRTPLPKGTIINWNGLLAEIVEDTGDNAFMVNLLDFDQTGKLVTETANVHFAWEVDGHICKVVSADRNIYEQRLQKKSAECRVSGTGWLCVYKDNKLIPVCALNQEQITAWNEIVRGRLSQN